MIVNGRVRLAEVDSLLYTPEEGVPRPEHVGIFTKCIGELDNVSYLGANFDIRAIEDYLLELYGCRYVGFETWEEFIPQFRSTWNREILQLVQNIKAAEEITVVDSKERITVHSSGGNNGTTHGVGENQYSNVPNQLVPNTFQGVTDFNKGDSTQTNEQSFTSDAVTEKEDSGNVFERWLELSAKNKNIVFQFLDKFEWLFLSTFICF